MNNIRKGYFQKESNLFLVTSIIIFVLYCIVVEQLLMGNAYYETGAVFFKTVYLKDNFYEIFTTLDNGYLSWYAMFIAFVVHKLFGITENFFIVATLLNGLIFSLAIASFTLKKFDFLVQNRISRFLIVIFFGGFFYFSGRYGDFTFLHNSAYGLIFFAIIQFIDPKYNSSKKWFLIITLFFVIYANSKAYFVLFLPLSIMGVIYSYLVKNRQNLLFYLLVGLSSLFQVITIAKHQGQGVSQVLIEGYNIFYGMIDSIVYGIGTYAYFLFYPLQQLSINPQIVNIFTFIFIIGILFIFIRNLIKDKNYDLLFGFFVMNFLGFGSIFLTLYGSTGMLEYPRFLISLSQYIRVSQERQLIILNTTTLLSILIMINYFYHRYINSNKVIVEVLLYVAVLEFILLSPALKFNWDVLFNTKYMFANTTSDFKKSDYKLLEKNDTFFLLSSCDPGVNDCMSDLSTGYSWLNNDPTLYSKMRSEKEKDKHYISEKDKNSKIKGIVVFPNTDEFVRSRSITYTFKNPDDEKNNKLMEGNNSYLEILEHPEKNYSAIMHVTKKDFVYRLNPNEISPKKTMNLFDDRNLYLSKVLDNSSHVINIDTDKSILQLYYVPIDGSYEVTLYDEKEMPLETFQLEHLTLYEKFKYKFLLPIYYFLSTGENTSDNIGPIHWLNINTNLLKGIPKTIKLTPKDNEKGKSSLIYYVNKKTENTFIRAILDFSKVVAYDENGTVISSTNILDGYQMKPYHYFYFKDVVEGAKYFEFFDSKGKKLQFNNILIYVGRP